MGRQRTSAVASLLGLEFGETRGKMMAKLRSTLDCGIFPGVRLRSNEFWVATVTRTWKVRPVRRLPEVDRWSSDSVKWVSRTLWNRFQGDEQADGDIPEGKAVESPPQEVKTDHAPQERTITTKRQVLREFYINRKDAEKHGYTRGCPVCGSWFRGVGKQPLTAEWWERFRKTGVRRCSCAVGKTRKGSGLQRKTKEEKKEDKVRKQKRGKKKKKER